MSKYELVVILDAQLSQNEKDEILGQIQAIVEKGEGKVIKCDVWLEKHKFSFPMKKVNEGTYYTMDLELKRNAITKLRTDLRLNERVLRTLLVKAEEKAFTV